MLILLVQRGGAEVVGHSGPLDRDNWLVIWGIQRETRRDNVASIKGERIHRVPFQQDDLSCIYRSNEWTASNVRLLIFKLIKPLRFQRIMFAKFNLIRWLIKDIFKRAF